MSLSFASEVWEALRTHIDYTERKDAADSLINLLIDQNYEPEDIKENFRSDKELLTALKDYLEEHDLGEDYAEYEEDEEEDDWD